MMSQHLQRSQTNGASLEDCHTNFFSLTDLHGINWRVYSWECPTSGSNSGTSAPENLLQDPVLQSYARCLSADILCVWRRVWENASGGKATSMGLDPFSSHPSQVPGMHSVHHPQTPEADAGHRQTSLHSSPKELWVFWYGDEPDLSRLVSSELVKGEDMSGTWNSETGLSYECRTLLFKALHNFIERCLLNHDFVRLGRWFVLPYEGPQQSPASRSTHLSISLSFFVHGESNVCASVDVRQHPPVRQLTKKHLLHAQQSNHGIPVILSPYGMAGTLTGVVHRMSDPSIHRLLEDWKQFFPISAKRSPKRREGLDSSLPPVVEVIVGNTKMRYPMCYVLVTDMDDRGMLSHNNILSGIHVPETTQKQCDLENQTMLDSSEVVSRPLQNSPFTASTHSLMDRDFLSNGGKVKGSSRTLVNHVWQDFIQCPRQCASPAPEDSVATTKLAVQWDFIDPATVVSCSCSKCLKGRSGCNIKGTKGERSCGGSGRHRTHPTPFHQRLSSLSHDLGPLGIDPEEFPGLLEESDVLQVNRLSSSSTSGGGNLCQFTGYKCGLPTPSSAPSLQLTNAGDGPTASVDSQASVDPSPLQSQSLSASHLDPTMPTLSPHPPPSFTSGVDPSTPDNVDMKPTLSEFAEPKLSVNQDLSPYPTLRDRINGYELLDSSYSDWNTGSNIAPTKGFKRPMLPRSEYEDLLDSGKPNGCLYEDSKVGLWANGSVKKLKSAEQEKEEGLWPPYRPSHVIARLEVHIKEEVKNEVDDKAMFNIKSEPQSPQSNERITFPAEQCPVSASDSSEDEPIYPDHTPPGSNKSLGPSDDAIPIKLPHLTSLSNSNHSSGKIGQNSLVEELTKMFPTPPSHEHNPEHDPVVDDMSVSIPLKEELLEDSTKLFNFDSNQYVKEEFSDDPASVFKPPLMAMFVGSDKYRSLINLPSHMEPVIVLPPECVYKPSWQFPLSEKHQVTGSHMGPVSSLPRAAALKLGMSPASPSTSSLGCPLTDVGPLSQRGPGSVGGPSSAGPNYELPSPASNQSAYLSKTLPSVEPPTTANQVPESNSLVVNIVLQDSSINLFRDHNFDSCTICVCNSGHKVVGNIRGSDGSLYLPSSHLSIEEENIKCTCGFSAIVNRRLAYQSGLFYEDEVDLTGLHQLLLSESRKPSLSTLPEIKSDGLEQDRSMLDCISLSMYELVQSLCLVTLGIPYSVLFRTSSLYRDRQSNIILNSVDFQDGNEVACSALEQSRLSLQPFQFDSESCFTGTTKSCMHKWCYFQFEGPSCSQDMMRCVKALEPHLQEAIRRSRNPKLVDPLIKVEGPLTWRMFHRMAVRGTEDTAEPLPIPMLLTGHEKEWQSVAPQCLRHWEKLLLEPYSQQRSIAYVVVSPGNDFILPQIRTFFKELSAIYELCRLGKHAPARVIISDGIMRITNSLLERLADESVDEWFQLLGDSQVSTNLKAYSKICRHYLRTQLSLVTFDNSLFEPKSSNSRTSDKTLQGASNSHFVVPTSVDGAPPGVTSSINSVNSGSTNNCMMPNVNQSNNSSGHSGSSWEGQNSCPVSSSSGSSGSNMVEVDDDEFAPPAIMVYLIDPFALDQDNPDFRRLITLALIRCYLQVVQNMSEDRRSKIYVQIISLESILELASESHDTSRRTDYLKSLAFSVFMQCRPFLMYHSNVKSLTGFGPASVSDTFLKAVDPEAELNQNRYQMFFPPYVLAPIKESRGKCREAEEALGDSRELSTVLYCTYCISEDQRWLLATATDQHGEILETVTINIEVPNRTRRKKASARQYALKRLMDWLLGVMSMGMHPWRLVVGRMGRMGHGELKSWLSILSRKSLSQASKTLKEMCKYCSCLFPYNAPFVLSACVVALEPDSSFRMMPDIFTPDERFGQTSRNCTLSTPQDISCTHILVFPTSATAQSAQSRFQEDTDEDVLFADDDNIDFGGGDMGLMSDLFLENDDGLLGAPNEPYSLPQSPAAEGPVPDHFSCQATSNGLIVMDPQEDIGNAVLQQQPLALGYYVSTAPTGRLPHWFWSSCPHLESACPVFLKAALHLNQPTATQSEDYLLRTTNNKGHPLDSSCTADVLRYVLEGYNSLSWLVLDPASQDRRSCLPLHMQVLANLYNTMAALF